ncbi:MAG: FAD-dependent 5-carboxymethylaminomethyl-2-thiouridine(34) oxidoreductase MnmC [Pseudomonadota bacterium]
MTRRLPPAPDLEWGDDGAPRDRRAGDIYFSPEDGLSEARAVFLRGCGLPERWAGRSSFTIGELGFGTGLNFLAAWDAWRGARPRQDAWLHFVSIEGQPLDRDDAARALAVWGEIEELAARLLDRWPDRARGVQRMSWPDDGVSLTLHIDEIDRALAGARLQADAWFLDGYAPSRNPEMWSLDTLGAVAAHSKHDARAGTFTVAGAVRRNLETAGFSVVKAPGHGRKRERLEARLERPATEAGDPFALRSQVGCPNTVAVIGAGIAGACAAQAFLDRGAAVSVFDSAAGPGLGASGNLLALLMPRLDAADTDQARLLIDAYLHARAAYAGLPGAEPCEVVQKPASDTDAERIAKVLADPPLGLENLEAIREGGLLHKGGMVLRPAALLPALLDGASMHVGVAVDVDLADRTVNGEAFDAVVVCSGMAASSIQGLAWLPLEGRLGQVETVSGAAHTAASAVASGRYALTSNGDRLVGASFEPADGSPQTSDAARKDNLAQGVALSPWMKGDFNRFEISSRAAIRATTPDRLPFIGAAPDYVRALETFGGLRTGVSADRDGPRWEGVYLATGFGARGFTWGPFAGAILAAQAFGDPAPAAARALEAVSPMRIIRRGLKRGEL